MLDKSSLKIFLIWFHKKANLNSHFTVKFLILLLNKNKREEKKRKYLVLEPRLKRAIRNPLCIFFLFENSIPKCVICQNKITIVSMFN